MRTQDPAGRNPLSHDAIFSEFLDLPTLGFITDDLPIALDRSHPTPNLGKVVYSTVKQPDIVTGIRSDHAHSDSVVITAGTQVNGVTVASVYEGALQAVPNAPASKWHTFQPTFTGQTVTSSTFYGPNTALFDPSLGRDNIRAVGSYKYAEASSGPKTDHGMIYQGSLDGSGTWTQIDPTPLVKTGETLLNTIAHSTMGALTVGNYDTDLATGHAFIYSVMSSSWTELNPTHSTSSTAYGIWQNGGSSSTHYTVTGGFSDLNHGGVDEGYVIDYDSATGALTHLKTFNFDNKPITSLVSHFDGITATEKGYNLTGEYVDIANGNKIGGFFASIARLPNGSFSDADWTSIAFPSADLTTGNTVIGNNVLGIYAPGQGSDISTYLATISHPSSFALS